MYYKAPELDRNELIVRVQLMHEGKNCNAWFTALYIADKIGS